MNAEEHSNSEYFVEINLVINSHQRRSQPVRRIKGSKRSANRIRALSGIAYKPHIVTIVGSKSFAADANQHIHLAGNNLTPNTTTTLILRKGIILTIDRMMKEQLD